VDSQFTFLGLQTNELDVQSASTVLQTLRSLPSYTVYVPSDVTSKQNTLYSFFARSTVPWSLTCEGQGKTRDLFLTAVSDQIEGFTGGTKNLNAIIAGGLIILLLSVIVLLVMICPVLYCNPENLEKKSFIWRKNINWYLSCGLVIGATQVGLGVMIVVSNSLADSNFNSANQKIQATTMVNGCSGQYTKVNAEYYAEIIAGQ
jgi:hypothetical protein